MCHISKHGFEGYWQYDTTIDGKTAGLRSN